MPGDTREKDLDNLKRTTKRLLTLIFVSLTIYGFGQSQKDQLKIANAASVEATDFYEEIPFTDKGGYFVIPVTIGSKTYDYIFDTGGYNTVTSEIMSQNALPELMNVSVGSSNQIKSKIILSKIPRLKVGDVSFKDVGVFNFDFNDAPIITCYTNGGLLGKSIIRQSVWQIDYRNKIIRVTDKIDKMPNLENSTKLKVELDKVFNPFIQIGLNGQKQKFMLDFGYGGFVSLTLKTANEYKFKSTIETVGEGAIGANGATKEPMYISPLEEVNIAGQSLTNQVVFYSPTNNYNLIGSEIAKYFIVTLNFKESELILTPIDREYIDTFRSFGIDINTNGKEIYVSRIYKGLNAEKVGIEFNDKIISINNFSVDSLNLCDSFLNFRETIQQADTLDIKVKRNDTERTFKIEKEDLR